MKNAKWMLPLTLMMLSGLMAAQSFMTSRVVAQVPFEYVVNNKIMPAGESLVKAASMDSRTLAINNFDARQSGLVDTPARNPKMLPTRPCWSLNVTATFISSRAFAWQEAI